MGAINSFLVLILFLLMRSSQQLQRGHRMKFWDGCRCISKCFEKPDSDIRGEMTKGYICLKIKNFISCARSCPEGATVLTAIANIAPSFFKLLHRTCVPDNQNQMVDIPFLEKITNDFKDVAKMLECVNECVKRERLVLKIPHGGICRASHYFAMSLKTCPHGDKILNEVKTVLPIFDIMERACASSAASSTTPAINTYTELHAFVPTTALQMQDGNGVGA